MGLAEQQSYGFQQADRALLTPICEQSPRGVQRGRWPVVSNQQGCRMQNRGRVVPAVFSGQAPGRFQQRGARVVVEQVDHGIEAHLGHGGVSPPFVDVGSHADREDLTAHDTDNLSGTVMRETHPSAAADLAVRALRATGSRAVERAGWVAVRQCRGQQLPLARPGRGAGLSGPVVCRTRSVRRRRRGSRHAAPWTHGRSGRGYRNRGRATPVWKTGNSLLETPVRF